MRIRPVVADLLAALTCLVGSWSCGGNDSALDRAGNIGAAEIKPPKAASLTEHKWGGGDNDDEKGECSRTGARTGNHDAQDAECSQQCHHASSKYGARDSHQQARNRIALGNLGC